MDLTSVLISSGIALVASVAATRTMVQSNRSRIKRLEDLQDKEAERFMPRPELERALGAIERTGNQTNNLVQNYLFGSIERKQLLSRIEAAAEKAVFGFALSDRGLALIKHCEGLRLTAYRDGAGVLTIGYGHTGKDVQDCHTITQSEANTLLLSDVAAAVVCVNQAVTAPINQNQFDALVDFAFNCGRHNLLSSTLLVDVNNSDFTSAADQFSRWVHAGNEIEKGLVLRRQAEASLFMEAM